MRFKIFLISFLLGGFTYAQENHQAEIKKQLKAFYKNMASDKEAVQKKALADILPDEKTFKMFLTEEEMKLIMPFLKKIGIPFSKHRTVDWNASYRMVRRRRRIFGTIKPKRNG